MAVQILRAAIADGARVLPEEGIERVDVIVAQGLFITIERGLHLGNDLRQVNVHSIISRVSSSLNKVRRLAEHR